MKPPSAVTRNDLAESPQRKTIEQLNQQLAEAIDLRLQANQAHWNVKGPNFIGLRKAFYEVDEVINEFVDELGECAVQLLRTPDCS